jgi:hypothetical protein
MERTPSAESGRSLHHDVATGRRVSKFGALDVRDFKTLPDDAVVNSQYDPPPGDWPVATITNEQRRVARETGFNTLD